MSQPDLLDTNGLIERAALYAAARTSLADRDADRALFSRSWDNLSMSLEREPDHFMTRFTLHSNIDMITFNSADPVGSLDKLRFNGLYENVMRTDAYKFYRRNQSANAMPDALQYRDDVVELNALMAMDDVFKARFLQSAVDDYIDAKLHPDFEPYFPSLSYPDKTADVSHLDEQDPLDKIRLFLATSHDLPGLYHDQLDEAVAFDLDIAHGPAQIDADSVTGAKTFDHLDDILNNEIIDMRKAERERFAQQQRDEFEKLKQQMFGDTDNLQSLPGFKPGGPLPGGN